MPQIRNFMKYLVCITLILAFAGCAATRTRESTGGYVDDSVITTKVKAELIEDPLTKAYQINVKTFKGVVQLSGFVNSAQEKQRAGEVARGVNGVKDVKNDLNVK
jgi:osmotically-inducible protein OsmY